MKQILILLLIIIIAPPATAKTQGETNTSYHTYTGNISNKYPITVFLIFSKDKVNGGYFYNKNKQYIDLKGNIKDNKITLNEYSFDKHYDKKVTGIFEGVINNDNTISGTWHTPDNTKNLTYNIKIYDNPRSDFKYNNKYIHPEIIEMLIDGDIGNEVIDIAGSKTTEQVIYDGNKITIEHPTWPAVIGKPFFSYEIIAQKDNIYFLNTAWNGGGSGYFNNLAIIARVDNFIFVAGNIAGGDRANGGISKVEFDNGQIHYSQYITPYDIYSLGTINKPELKAYADLECSANSYYGTYEANYNIEKLERTFIGIKFNDEKAINSEGWTDQYRYQKCFNNLYNNYIENKKTKLNQEEINKFDSEFINTCINQFNLSHNR